MRARYLGRAAAFFGQTMLTHAPTLTRAVALRNRPGAVSLILNLEGARYYVFHSRQTPEQVANAMTFQKINLHQELRGQPPLANAQRQAEWARIVPTAHAVAAQSSMDDGRHAEESMIESWSACLDDFVRLRGRRPTSAEVYLTHCPCQMSNQAPSPARVLDGMTYAASCHLKLRAFCTTGTRASTRWCVYYEHPFQGARLDETHGSLVIAPLPAHIEL
ncbi:MAG: hypothetical protein ABW252_13210 [Polyangiales bacterium]